MKKIIILFLILFSSELISQTWELMYKEDFLYHDSTANEHTNFCTGLVIRNDSIIIPRENGSSSLFLIFNYSNKNWSFILSSGSLDRNINNPSSMILSSRISNWIFSFKMICLTGFISLK